MNIYRYKTDPDNYAIELVEDYSDGEWVISSQFNQGQLLASSWHPVEFRAVTPKGKVGDFPKPHLSIPVFSEKAWNTLGPLIENDAEALPLIGPNGSYFAINVFRIVECLDLSCAEVTHYPDGSIQKVVTYCFKTGCLDGLHMFLLAETSGLEVLVSEHFKNCVEANPLEGLRFIPINMAE
jgi:hypothetical protein